MEEDKISQLPNDILIHNLSLIDIHEAVKTTILSKRWKGLWRPLSCLRFRDVPSFVSHLLSRRDPSAPVHDFHFSSDDGIFPLGFVMKCVTYAVTHGVKSLCLHAPTRLTLRLPASFFASTTLRELELRQFEKGIYLPKRFSLPNLKTLFLESELYFDDEESEPFAGFPELERLTLRGFPIPRLVLKAPKLRILEISYYDSVEEISAPLLTSFTWHSCSPLQSSKMNLPLLEEVYLSISNGKFDAVELHNFVRMLHQLRNATTVKLTLDTLKIFEWHGDIIGKNPPPFPNIKCLKVVKNEYHDVRTVFKGVMDYLTVGTLNFESLMVEFPDDVDVVEHNDHDIDYY